MFKGIISKIRATQAPAPVRPAPADDDLRDLRIAVSTIEHGDLDGVLQQLHAVNAKIQVVKDNDPAFAASFDAQAAKIATALAEAKAAKAVIDAHE